MNSKDIYDRKYSEVDLVAQPLRFEIPSRRLRPQVEQLIRSSSSIADFGCGHGGAMLRFHRLNPGAKIVGYDYSDVALAKVREQFEVVQIDFNGEKFPSGKFDLIYCTQVIEHLDNDGAFLGKISESLVNGGHLVLTTVYKKPNAWYFYKNSDGESVVDPTHMREYTDVGILLGLLRSNGFEVLDHDITLVKYPVIDIVLKLLTRCFKGRLMYKFINSSFVMLLRMCFVVPIPRFYNFQILSRKNVQ
jgi:2-polyprenyl-3-methyl-5-hydroxy-6-metoxy-1,4-benzoquinol methylase